MVYKIHNRLLTLKKKIMNAATVLYMKKHNPNTIIYYEILNIL